MSHRPFLAAALPTTTVAVASGIIVLVDVMWDMAFWSSGVTLP